MGGIEIMSFQEPFKKKEDLLKLNMLFAGLKEEDISTIENVKIKLFWAELMRPLLLKESELKIKEGYLDRNLEIELIKRLDHVTSILEDFLNSNKEILKRIELLNNNLFNPEKIERVEEMIEIQDLSDEVIEEIISDYVKMHKKETIYPSDIAFAFNLDAEKVFNICQKLIEEGKLIG